MDDERRIAAVEDVPADSTLLFTVREVGGDASGDGPTGDDDEREAILVAHDDGVAGWFNHCQHYTHVDLDKGSGAPMRDGEVVCANHGAYFEADTGYCTFGPCEGAYLEGLDVTVEDGAVYLADGDYAFVRVGGIETDPADRSYTNPEF